MIFWAIYKIFVFRQLCDKQFPDILSPTGTYPSNVLQKSIHIAQFDKKNWYSRPTARGWSYAYKEYCNKIREFQSDVDLLFNSEKCGRDFIYMRITFCIAKDELFIQFELSSWQSEALNYLNTYAFFPSSYEWTFIIFSITLAWFMVVWGHQTSINQPKNVECEWNRYLFPGNFHLDWLDCCLFVRNKCSKG